MEKQENRLSIGRINGVEIFAVKDEDNQVFVPVKPLCEAIGVRFDTQFAKLQEHPILASTVALRATVGSDGKDREMVCLPHEFIYGWIFTINPKNVSEGARDNVIRYQKQCYKALYDYFNGKSQRQQEVIDMERTLLNEKKELDETLAGLMKSVSEVKAKIKSIDGKFAELQSERLNPTPSLFD